MVIKFHWLITVEYRDASSINKFCNSKICIGMCKVKVKVKFIIEQATQAQWGSRGIAVLFL